MFNTVRLRMVTVALALGLIDALHMVPPVAAMGTTCRGTDKTKWSVPAGCTSATVKIIGLTRRSSMPRLLRMRPPVLLWL